MAKITKEELISKVNGYDISDEVKMELMEDITDSMDTSAYDDLKSKYDDLVEKYKSRFMDVVEDVARDVVEEAKDLEEKEVVDVKLEDL